MTYRLGNSVALSARAYLPLEQPDGAEIAAGIDWQPLRSIPAHILAERREAVGSSGRSAFSITAYGGFSDAKVIGPVEADSYVQAGAVGMRSRDLFIDGSARLFVRRGATKIGGGLWGAAQPGAQRLDIGPHLSRATPVGIVSLDWRFRIAGEASPGSGPVLTVGRDF